MASSIIKDIREYYHSLKDNNGEWREDVIGCISSAKTPKDNIKYIKDILTVVLYSDKIHEETKLFIKNRGMSIKEINKIVNERKQKQAELCGKAESLVNYSMTGYHIRLDNEKLEKYFGNGILRDIVYDRASSDESIKNRLNKFRLEYGTSNELRNNLLINIKHTDFTGDVKISSEEFFDILGSLEVYLRQRKEIIEGVINSNEAFVSYFNYLLSIDALNDEAVVKDVEKLFKFLNNEGIEEEDEGAEEEDEGAGEEDEGAEEEEAKAEEEGELSEIIW